MSALPSGTSPLTTCSEKGLEVFKGTYAADFSAHGVGTLVSSAHHHFVDDNLFSAKDNAILADDSCDCAAKIQTVISHVSSNELTFS